MKNKNKFLTGTLAILIVMVAAVSFNDENKITGFAAKDIAGTESDEYEKASFYGVYSIAPNFRIKTDYNLNIYDILRSQAENLMSKAINCEATTLKTLRQCIEENFPSGWSFSCDTGTKKILYDFADNYQNCIDSTDNNCYCEYSLEYNSNDIQRYNLEGEHEISLSEHDPNSAAVLSEKPVAGIFAMILFGNKCSWYPNRFSIEYGGSSLDNVKFNFKDELAGTEHELTDLREITLYKHILPSGKESIDFVKREGNKFIYPNGDEVSAPLRKCRSGRTFGFCYDSGKEYPVYDKEKGRSGIFNITYEFALYFKDEPPKPLTGLEIKDNKKADKSVILKWNKAEEADVVQYNIFYSQKSFISESTDEIKGDQEINIIPISTESANLFAGRFYIVEGDINLENCEYAYSDKKCLYKITTNEGEKLMALEKDALYNFIYGDKNYLVYIIDNVENVNYNFAVTAVDRNNNEIDNLDPEQRLTSRENYNSGSSQDDLGPELINFENVDTSIPGQFKIKWFRPENNFDGTPLEPAELLSYVIYYRGCEAVFAYPRDDTASTERTYHESEFTPCPEPDSLEFSYYFAVFAKDSRNNPADDDIKLWPHEILELQFTPAGVVYDPSLISRASEIPPLEEEIIPDALLSLPYIPEESQPIE